MYVVGMHVWGRCVCVYVADVRVEGCVCVCIKGGVGEGQYGGARQKALRCRMYILYNHLPLILLCGVHVCAVGGVCCVGGVLPLISLCTITSAI